MFGDLDDFLSGPVPSTANNATAPSTGGESTFSLLMPSAPAASLVQPLSLSGLPPAVQQAINALPDLSFMTANTLVMPKEGIMDDFELLSMETGTDSSLRDASASATTTMDDDDGFGGFGDISTGTTVTAGATEASVAIMMVLEALGTHQQAPLRQQVLMA